MVWAIVGHVMAFNGPMPPERLRADALANQAKLIDAARAIFADRGINAPLEDIAKQAGVGIATLYRRFGTRDHLIVAAFQPKMEAWADTIAAALADPDVTRAFPAYLRGVFAQQFQDRGFTDVLGMDFPMSPEIEEARQRGIDGFTELVRRAKRAGCLRKDFSPEDLLIFLMANAGVIHSGGGIAQQASDRLLGYILQASRPQGATKLPPAPTADQIRADMRRFPHRTP